MITIKIVDAQKAKNIHQKHTHQQDIYSSPKMEPTQHPMEWAYWFFPRLKWPEHKVNHSTPYSANINNGAINILPLYASMAWIGYLYFSYHFLLSSNMLHALPTYLIFPDLLSFTVISTDYKALYYVTFSILSLLPLLVSFSKPQEPHKICKYF
jgi:hypothetical protein